MEHKKEFAGHKKVGASLLHNVEQKFVKWGTPKIPKNIETWHLTLMTIVWCAGVLIFGYLSKYNMNWLWGSSVMIACQYITDLFDGAVGRHRNTGLIKWGYYADHFLDYMFMSCILIGYSFFIPDKFGMLFFVVIILMIVAIIPTINKNDCNDYVFECNPHYFGPQYAYPNPECNDSFINVTGNYCNGKLVCQNQLR